METREVWDERQPGRHRRRSTRPREDFRATSTAFSQLTGVLGGFCITVLVLVLDSARLSEHRSAQDWIAGLVLFASLCYIAGSGLLANAMNVPAFRQVFQRSGPMPGGMFAFQTRVFTSGIVLFHLGNLLLGPALAIIAYQFSLRVGLAATTIALLVVAYIALVNFGQFGAKPQRSARD